MQLHELLVHHDGIMPEFLNSDVLGHLFLFCFKVPEFRHVDSYLDKEHRYVFLPAEFRIIFKTKKNKIGLCFLTVTLKRRKP